MYIIIGKENCIYCKMSKELLDKKKIKYQYYDLFNDKENYSKYNHLIPESYNFVPKIIKLKPNENLKGTFLKKGYEQLSQLLEKTKKTKKKQFNTNTNRNTNIKTTCAPKKETKFNTCFDKPALINIITTWNTINKDNLIKYKKTDSVNILWNKVNNKFKYKCNTELCWLKDGYINKNKYKRYFKPFKPDEWNQNPREWLSTLDIEAVLKQYESKFPEFFFIGSVPIDFDYELSPGNCVVNELCKINIDLFYRKNKTKVGIVFNLDKHNQPGSHWVALFCNFDKKELNYFDSYGYSVPDEINTLMKRLQIQSKEKNINLKLNYNDVRHQYKNSECGIYCINFIISMLENKNFKNFCNKIVSDDTIFKKRKYLFIE